MHSDPAYAAGTPFKVPIAPGIYTAGLISAVIGTKLPGPGAIYLSQSLKFVKPVKAGPSAEGYGAVLVGSAVNGGRWLPEVAAVLREVRLRAPQHPAPEASIANGLVQIE